MPELGLAGQNAIEPGDVIHAVNGTAVDAVDSLRSTLESVPDGAPIVLQIERAGMLSYVIPGAMPAAEQRLKKTSTTCAQRVMPSRIVDNCGAANPGSSRIQAALSSPLLIALLVLIPAVVQLERPVLLRVHANPFAFAVLVHIGDERIGRIVLLAAAHREV